jgi:hypothetical protein
VEHRTGINSGQPMNFFNIANGRVSQEHDGDSQYDSLEIFFITRDAAVGGSFSVPSRFHIKTMQQRTV